MRVILFGTGAMACHFAVRLSRVSEVTLLGTWAEAIEAIRKQGILCESAHERLAVRVNADYLGSPIQPADVVIILVKSWQTKSVAEHLDRYLAADAVAISLQNGLGNLDLLGPRAFAGSTAEGATLLGPGYVRAGGSGPTHMVAPDRVIRLFQSAGLECRSCSRNEADSLLWGKLTISCGINALTALLRIPNGELLAHSGVRELMIKAATECASVAEKKDIQLPFSDPAARVREVAEKTALNLSSMLQDVLRGARTECDAINGAIAAEGERLGVPTPVNNTLWRLVQAAVHLNRSKAGLCR
jgi:2-dehydropantoate 2-reductase